MSSSTKKAIASGAVMAATLLAIPFLRFVFSYLGILFHELGHAVAAWIFGYPAVPAFDFLYGGGVTLYQDRSFLLSLVVAATLAGLVYAVRAHRRIQVAAAVLAGLWLLLAVTPLHRLVVTSSGHGAEIALAGLFLWRALTNRGIKIPAERPLYACMGFFVLALNLGLAGRLLGSETFRIAYAEGKGGCLRHDLQIVADDFLHTGVQAPALLLALAALATPLAVYGVKSLVVGSEPPAC